MSSDFLDKPIPTTLWQGKIVKEDSENHATPWSSTGPDFVA